MRCMILNHRVPVLPQNPSIAIHIATSSTRTAAVTTVFAGELVKLESLLVLIIKKKALGQCGRSFR